MLHVCVHLSFLHLNSVFLICTPSSHMDKWREDIKLIGAQKNPPLMSTRMIKMHHHNSNSNLDLERLLQARSLANRTWWFRHLPKPCFYSDLQLENHFMSYKTRTKIMGKTTMPHVTHLLFVTLTITLWIFLCEVILIGIMSCLHPQGDLIYVIVSVSLIILMADLWEYDVLDGFAEVSIIGH